MKNTLVDLNNYLFEALERVNDNELSSEELDKELQRADATTKIAKTIVENTNLALKIKKHLDEYGKGDNYQIPGMVEAK